MFYICITSHLASLFGRKNLKYPETMWVYSTYTCMRVYSINLKQAPHLETADHGHNTSTLIITSCK